MLADKMMPQNKALADIHHTCTTRLGVNCLSQCLHIPQAESRAHHQVAFAGLCQVLPWIHIYPEDTVFLG